MVLKSDSFVSKSCLVVVVVGELSVCLMTTLFDDESGDLVVVFVFVSTTDSLGETGFVGAGFVGAGVLLLLLPPSPNSDMVCAIKSATSSCPDCAAILTTETAEAKTFSNY